MFAKPATLNCTYASCVSSTTRHMPSIARSRPQKRFAKKTRQIFAITSSRRPAPISQRMKQKSPSRNRPWMTYLESDFFLSSDSAKPATLNCTYASCVSSTTRHMPSIARSRPQKRFAKKTRQIFAITSSRRPAPISQRMKQKSPSRNRPWMTYLESDFFFVFFSFFALSAMRHKYNAATDRCGCHFSECFKSCLGVGRARLRYRT